MFENRQILVKRHPTDLAPIWSPAPMSRAAPPQQISLADVGRTILKRKIPIILFATAVFLASILYIKLKTPLYEGSARLQIDPSRPSELNLNEREKLVAETDVDSRLKTEVEIIHSNAVVTQAIQSLKLHMNPVFAGPDATSSPNISALSPSARRRLIDKFDANLTVKIIPSTQVVEVRFRSPDPALASDISNSIVDEYMQRTFQTRVDGSAQVSQWLSRQMEEIRDSTNAAQQRLANFQRDNNLLGTNETDNIVTDRLKQLNEELTKSEADRIIKEGRYRLAKAGNPELIASVIPNITLQMLRTQEAELQAQHSQLAAKFGNGYPKLGEIESQLARLKSAISTEGGNVETRLANEYDAAAKSEAMIRDDFEKQKAEAYKLNEHVAQYAILKHDVESGRQLYDTLQLRVKEAGVTSGMASTYVSVIDRSQTPDTPVEPKKKFYLALGLGGGLFGGLMLAFVMESFDDTMRGSEEVEALTGLPELGSVPFLPALSSKQPRKAREMLVDGSAFRPASLSDPTAADAYRALCSLILLSSDNSQKVFVLTSAMAGDGKTATSCNMAAALAQYGKRVLLVDADLRRSSMHIRFGIRPGVTTMVQAGSTEFRCYQPIAELPKLHVVPAGLQKTSQVDILAAPRIQELLASCRDDYDYIIVDTPPVLPFADALVLAARADGVILVTRSGVSRNKAVMRARDVLIRSGANVLGFVLNAVQRPEYYYSYPAEYRQLTVSNPPRRTSPSETTHTLGDIQ